MPKYLCDLTRKIMRLCRTRNLLHFRLRTPCYFSRQITMINSKFCYFSLDATFKQAHTFFLFKKSICHLTFFFYRKWVPLARTEPPNLSESLNWGKRTMAIVWSSSVSWVAIRSPRSPGFAKVKLITCFHDSSIYKSMNFFTKFSLIYSIQGKVGD